MNIFRKIVRKFSGATRTAVKYLAGMSIVNDTGQSKLTDFNSYLKTGTGKVWATFRALDIVANTVMETRNSLINANTGKEIKNDRSGLAELLKNPYEGGTLETLIYTYVFHIKLTGNFFLLMDERSVSGQPTKLWPLIPSKVKIYPSKESGELVRQYSYTVNGTEYPLDREDVIQMKRPNPDNEYWGLGDVQAAEPLFNDYLSQSDTKTKINKQGGIPNGVLVNEEFDGTEEEWTRLRQKWAKQYTGKENVGKVGWLTGKWKFLKLGMTNSEMQTTEREEKSIKQIILHHGVPLSIFGIEKAANYATSRQDTINYKKYTCYPLALIFFRTFNERVVSKFDKRYKLDFEVSGLQDGEAIVKEYLPLLKEGCITPNEIRTLMGLPKSDNPLLDNFYIHNQLIPLEMVGFANAYNSIPDDIYGNQLEDAGGDPDDPNNYPPESTTGNEEPDATEEDDGTTLSNTALPTKTIKEKDLLALTTKK